MLTIRIYKETKELIVFLRKHKVNFTARLRNVIHTELATIAKDFKYLEEKTPF